MCVAAQNGANLDLTVIVSGPRMPLPREISHSVGTFHWRTVFAFARGTDVLADRPANTWCAATWRADGHPDHEAVGRAAAVAASRTGAVLVEYPVWMWHWAYPEDEAVPWHRAARVPLNSEAQQRKRDAIAAFRSQLESDVAGRDPILPPHVLARLDCVGEVVFR